MTKAQIARTFRKQHPDYPTLKLARIMYNEHNLTFTNIEDARTSLRYIEGKSGKTSRKNLADKSMVIEQSRPLNPYSLPESDEEKAQACGDGHHEFLDGDCHGRS